MKPNIQTSKKPNIHVVHQLHCQANDKILGNNVKGRILKRVFQENKAHQIFRKTNISYHLIPPYFRRNYQNFNLYLYETVIC